MTLREERESLIGEIAELQRQQVKAREEANLHKWTLHQRALDFDIRFARIGLLMHQLSKLDEASES